VRVPTDGYADSAYTDRRDRLTDENEKGVRPSVLLSLKNMDCNAVIFRVILPTGNIIKQQHFGGGRGKEFCAFETGILGGHGRLVLSVCVILLYT